MMSECTSELAIVIYIYQFIADSFFPELFPRNKKQALKKVGPCLGSRQHYCSIGIGCSFGENNTANQNINTHLLMVSF